MVSVNKFKLFVKRDKC